MAWLVSSNNHHTLEQPPQGFESFADQQQLVDPSRNNIIQIRACLRLRTDNGSRPQYRLVGMPLQRLASGGVSSSDGCCFDWIKK